ncbi:uroporphyrinogen decarboxylase [Natronoflexus pectinivorans]|uniref:Uroporphyrinogen decarboxylase n=1 Tax=Natronoflexus pectinivorans TaxID=682526 RepID=A0A4R2GE47_9BACT|nr:uroporphyrinogen decarboxylase [Natronoflexus pectinivorans]TCO06131.1 uroporphyrinogen decarboxylase [Natronoflexus pectinivorans]
MNSILLDTLKGETTPRPPVWFMRQAGRVLPNYNKLKENHTFREMMADPNLAAEVTLMPIADLGVDAAILFSDILVIPNAMGMELKWTDSGPLFPTPLSNFSSPVEHLKESPQKLEYIYDVIDEILRRRPQNIPLIGFCGAPLTTMCYMLQGVSSNGNFPDAMKFLFSNKAESKKLIDAIADFSVHYALKQIEHGVEVFQLFETHAGLIPTEMYMELFMPAVEKIGKAVRATGTPFIFFPKGFSTGFKVFTPDLCDFVSIDWQMPLNDAREMIHPEVGLQGNIDPRLLYASQEVIASELEKLKPFFRDNPKWILNLGHGFLPDIPYENARFVVDWVKSTKW